LRDNSPTLNEKGKETKMNEAENLTIKLTKAETLTVKLDKAVDLIERARKLVLQIIDEDETGAVATADLKFDEISDFISDIGYDVILATQQQEKEAERLAEIRALESRLAKLKAGGC